MRPFPIPSAVAAMRKILVIQQKMIGDVLVSSILPETLARAYPEARVDYLIYENTYPVIKENAANYRVVLFTDKITGCCYLRINSAKAKGNF